MTVLSVTEAPNFTIPGVRFVTLSSPSRGARESSVWEVTMAPGVNGSRHRLTREETFVAIEGVAIAEIDGQVHAFSAGDALLVAAGRDFSLSNPGPQPFRALAVYPVGGQVQIGDQPAFTPPWAE